MKQKEFPKDVIINSDLPLDKQHQVKEILKQFPHTLSDIPGKTDVIKHKIRVTDNTPFRIKQYPIPVHAQDAVEKEIDNMIACDVIRPSDSPFCSPYTIVDKKCGNIRLCMDFRKLNSITVFDAEPIPTLPDLLLKLEGAKFFTRLDLTKGYFQIPLEEESRQLTAFQTSRGLYEFCYMPFGLNTASCSFQKCMRKTLGHLKYVVFYFDDILIYSNTWDEHLVHIKTTLKTLQDAKLTAKPSKACVGCTSLDFLGHVVSRGTISPDKAKTQKIRDIQPPTTKKETRRILGLLSYYRSFVPNFSTIAQPLTDITRKRSPNKIRWTKECQNSLDKIKEVLISEPILRVPVLSKPFIVQSDASTKGIGAVLLQEYNGTLLPCHYASRRLLEREEHYAVCELECLALVYALHTFSKYLLMKPFYIQIDHAGLSFLKQNKSKNARLTRWALSIQQYTFTVQHIKGTANVVADFLSRH